MLRLCAILLVLVVGCREAPTPGSTEAHAGIVVFETDEERDRAIQRALAGEPADAYGLALDFRENGERDRHREWLSIASSRGWGPAMRDYGKLLLEGDPCDVARGRRLLQRYLDGDVGSGGGAGPGEIRLINEWLENSGPVQPG